jgi:hypothetical protein
MRFFFFFAVLPLIVFNLGCASAPVAYEAAKKAGHWETKVLIKDLKNAKNNAVSIDFVALRPDRLRAEVTGPMGISVATLAMNKDQISYALHLQKKFYHGVISDRSLGPLFQVRLHPRMLLYVLFDDPFPSSGWNCEKDEQGLVKECKSKTSDPAQQTTVRWMDRNGESKRIVILRADSEVQIFVKSFSTKVESDPGIFTLTAPASYKSYQIN